MVRTSRPWRILIAGAGCALFITCRDRPPRVAEGLPECPRQWDTISISGLDPVIVPPTGFALIGPITNVPEFHDCQKLLVDGGLAYGPLVALFAAYELDNLEQRLDSLRSSPTAERTSLSAALILNLESEYAPLNLQVGFSCLYVWRPAGRPSEWHAKIVFVDADHERCLEPIDPNALTGEDLKVFRDQVSTMPQETNYPPVARWDWDPITGQQYIGIKCGSGWCELGSATFNRSLPYLTDQASALTRVQRIKGWYDEQLLAIPGPDGRARPSGSKGTLFPHPQLALRSRQDYEDKWDTVAFIAIEPGLGDYKTKFNLDPVPAGSSLLRMNTLSLCSGTLASCEVPTATMQTSAECGTPDDAGHTWWIRIDPALGGEPMYRCVLRRDHRNLDTPIAATARWRWLLRDETSWNYCIQGCCEAQIQ